MQVVPLKKDTQFPRSDYIFDKYKDYKRVIPYLVLPKLEGQWVVTIIDFTMDAMKEIESSNLSSHIDLIAYMKPDLMEVFLTEYPQYANKTKSSWDQMKDIFITKGLNASSKALKILYQRCRGDIDKIFLKINEIEKILPEGEIITEKEVNAVVKEENIIFSRDIMLSLLLKHNKSIPSRGSFLSRFRNADTDKLVDRFVSELGKTYAFYALRKYTQKLYENKLKYLQDKDCKDMQVMQKLDVFTLAHATVCFEMANPRQLYVVLNEIERRRENDSDFERTFLLY